MICRRCACGCGGITNYGKKWIIGHFRIKYKCKSRLRKHPLYMTWVDMQRRCYNPKRKEYKNYGGRGIRVCIRWRVSFTSFLKDMGGRPKNNFLDRKDNNENYTPDNCRWATYKQQNRNKSTSLYLTYKGKTLLLVDWAEKTGIKYSTLKRRYYKKLKPNEIISSTNKNYKDGRKLQTWKNHLEYGTRNIGLKK